MKTKISISKYVIAIIFLCSIVSSCDKKEDKTSESKNTPTNAIGSNTSALAQFTSMAQILRETGRINKSDEKLPTEEAIKFIANSFNYEFCFPRSQFLSIKHGTVIIELPIIASEDKIFYVDALAGYNEAILKVAEKYKSYSDQNKKLMSCTAEILNISNDFATCQVNFYIGVGTYPAQNGMYPYGEHDEYMFNDGGGNCDTLTGIIPGSGASDILQNDINQNCLPIPAPGYRLYFEESSESPIFLNPLDYRNPNDVLDNIMDYQIYYTTEMLNGVQVTVPNSMKCLGIENDVNEMNFYYNGTYTAITSKLNYLSILNNTTESLYYIDILGTPVLDVANMYYTYVHQISLHYGIMHIIRTNGLPHEITD